MSSLSYEQELQACIYAQRPPQMPREANPVCISLLAVMNGLRPPRLDRPFSYCELFAGQGFGATLAAASFPDSTFHSIDPAPVNTIIGKDIARSAGVANVHHHQADLAGLHALELPPCDFLFVHEAHFLNGMHGGALLAKRLRSLLAPGGLCCVSYQCLPGAHEEVLLRQLLRQLVAYGKGDLEQRLNDALRHARAIVSAVPGGLEQKPGLKLFLDIMERGISPLMARELLHPGWQPFYHDQVQALLGESGLQYAAQLPLHHDFASLLLNKSGLEAYSPHAGTPVGESLKGLFAHQIVRQDMYHNGAPRMTPFEHRAMLGSTLFTLLVPPQNVCFDINTAHGTVSLDRELVTPLVERLRMGSASYDALLECLPPHEHESDLLLRILAMLIDSGQAHPLVSWETSSHAAMRLDRELLRRFAVDQSYCAAVTPRLGGGVALTWETQVLRMIMNQEDITPEQGIEVFLQSLENAGREFVQNGEAVKAPQLRQQQATLLWREFEERTMPLLRFLQGF